MRKCVMTCIVWLFSLNLEAAIPPELVVAVLTLATQVTAQTMGMVKTATTAATIAGTISVHMSSRPGSGGGGRKTREERWADQAAANKAEEDRSREQGVKSDQRERQQNGGLTNRQKEESQRNHQKDLDSYIENGRKTANQMDQKIQKGQGPKGIVRIDKPNTAVPGTKAHVHFEDGSAMNCDGTIHHNAPNGDPPKPNHKQARWLISHGWKVFGWMQRGGAFLLSGEAYLEISPQHAFGEKWADGEYDSIDWGWGKEGL